MIVWVDAHLASSLAPWLAETFDVEAFSVRFLKLQTAKDRVIFDAARAAGAVVMTKDEDFVHLVERLHPPPQVLWVTCGNTSNARLRQILTVRFPKAMELLRRGEPIVEISDRLIIA